MVVLNLVYPRVGPLPIIKISTPKIMTFLPTLLSDNENCKHKSNPIPYSLCTYLSGSAFLANSKHQNQQPVKVKSEFKFCDHVSNL